MELEASDQPVGRCIVVGHDEMVADGTCMFYATFLTSIISVSDSFTLVVQRTAAADGLEVNYKGELFRQVRLQGRNLADRCRQLPKTGRKRALKAVVLPRFTLTTLHQPRQLLPAVSVFNINIDWARTVLGCLSPVHRRLPIMALLSLFRVPKPKVSPPVAFTIIATTPGA